MWYTKGKEENPGSIISAMQLVIKRADISTNMSICNHSIVSSL